MGAESEWNLQGNNGLHEVGGEYFRCLSPVKKGIGSAGLGRKTEIHPPQPKGHNRTWLERASPESSSEVAGRGLRKAK